MSGEPPPLRARGERVLVHTPAPRDLEPYRRAVRGSRERLAPWNPVNPDDLAYHLRTQSDRHRTFLVRAREPEGEHDVVGKINVTNVQRGRALCGALGYDSYDPYAGRGLFLEGLRLVVDVAFAPIPHGMGLHRLEAAVQPGNVRSAGVLRRAGFRRRGTWPAYLWLSDAEGRDAWRDHVVYGVAREQWPAPEWVRLEPARPLLVLRGQLDDEATVEVARAVAREMHAPLLRDDADPALLGRRLLDAVSGAVVLTASGPDHIAGALMRAGLQRGPVVADAASITSAADVVRLALDALAAAGVPDAF